MRLFQGAQTWDFSSRTPQPQLWYARAGYRIRLAYVSLSYSRYIATAIRVLAPEGYRDDTNARSFALPPGEAFGKCFWQGVPLGLAMLSLLMGLIAIFRGFSFGGLAISGTDAVK